MSRFPLSDVVCFPLQILGNGNCLYAAVRRCIKVRRPGFDDYPFYPNRYLRRQVVAFIADHWEVMLEKLGPYLRKEYGVAGATVGGFNTPLTFRQYLRAQLEPRVWGDMAILFAISCMWDVRVTVLRVTMDEWRFRHKHPLRYSDMAFLLTQQHFSAIRKFSSCG